MRRLSSLCLSSGFLGVCNACETDLMFLFYSISSSSSLAIPFHSIPPYLHRR